MKRTSAYPAMKTHPHVHRTDNAWLRTSKAEPRGYIDPRKLRELWFHTGTACNLRCPDCFEHAAPGDQRLESPTFDEVKPFIDEASALGVEQLSFTGGEPFVAREFIRILEYALDQRPCLVLTNGTTPLRTRLTEMLALAGKPHRLSFRISLDYPDDARHGHVCLHRFTGTAGGGCAACVDRPDRAEDRGIPGHGRRYGLCDESRAPRVEGEG